MSKNKLRLIRCWLSCVWSSLLRRETCRNCLWTGVSRVKKKHCSNSQIPRFICPRSRRCIEALSLAWSAILRVRLLQLKFTNTCFTICLWMWDLRCAADWWNLAPYSLVAVYLHFGRIYSLQLQSQRVKQSMWNLIMLWLLTYSAYPLNLKMVIVGYCETFVSFYQTTRCRIP
jgi:hypothetical protein